MKKFLTIAALTTAVLMIGAACSSSEDAATTTTKADAASNAPTTVAADSESDSGTNAGSTGDPDVDALCAISKDMAEKISVNSDPAELSAINQEYQEQLEELSGKLSKKYNASNPPSAATAKAMGTCLAEAMSITSGIKMPEMPGSGN